MGGRSGRQAGCEVLGCRGGKRSGSHLGGCRILVSTRSCLAGELPESMPVPKSTVSSLLLAASLLACSSPQTLARVPPVAAAASNQVETAGAGPDTAQNEQPTAARVLLLRSALEEHSFERALCPEDIEDASVSLLHYADEKDAFENDYYEVEGRGVVLGIQDSQYIILTTRCFADLQWPNHDIRWRNIHGHEAGPPELCNEGLLIRRATAKGAGDEYFTFADTNVVAFPGDARQPEPMAELALRRSILEQARAVGDSVVVDRFRDGKGQWSDVALLCVPIRQDSTIRLRHLGLSMPRQSVRELLQKQGSLFGIEFEFSCEYCQKLVNQYRSRETQAFILGFGLGLVTGAVLSPMILRLQEIERSISVRGAGVPGTQFDPMRRIADAGLRRQILQRDNFTCAYAKFGMCDPSTCWACIAKDLHMDHVLAWSRGGRTVPTNLVAACAACNLSKGTELLSTWAKSRGQ